ncbi:MAG: outer membrane lipoprotein-sorting protein [Spirochaetales bacterium]|nr:outer membrane lipoprotein-sorting protein [Spirochaetales bacterium]
MKAPYVPFVFFTIIMLLPVFLTGETPPAEKEILAFLNGHGFASPDGVFTRVEEIIFPRNYHAVMEMETIEPGKRDRSITMESWYAKGKGTFMEFLSPVRQRGIRILQKEGSLWLYNPKSNSPRPVRLAPEDSFQGSVFSNNDIGDPQYSDDYRAAVVSIQEVDHPELGAIRLVGVEGTATHPKAPYGRIVMYLEAESLLPVKAEYYAKSGLLFKRMEFSDFRILAGTRRPGFFRMNSLEIDGYFSSVRFIELESLNSVEDWRFNESALTRR